jgi:hypothetical protein
MCDAIVRQGPEGRWPNVSPARKGWVPGSMIPPVPACRGSAVGTALYRGATQPDFTIRDRGTILSNEINAKNPSDS